jgi:hypothetical protein
VALDFGKLSRGAGLSEGVRNSCHEKCRFSRGQLRGCRAATVRERGLTLVSARNSPLPHGRGSKNPSEFPDTLGLSASGAFVRSCQMPDAMKAFSSPVSRPDSSPVSRPDCDPDDASEPGAADGKGAAHAVSGSSGWESDAGV